MQGCFTFIKNEVYNVKVWKWMWCMVEAFLSKGCANTWKCVFDSNFIWLYHIMNELFNYLHILILGTFSLFIKPKFVLTTHNKKINVLVMFLVLVNFHQISTWKIWFRPLQRIFHGKMDPNFARFPQKQFKLLDFYDKF
jgi:hypothetical protein